MTKPNPELSPTDVSGNPKAPCLECSEPRFFHALAPHLKSCHRMTVSEYQDKHPGAPVLSEMFREQTRKVGVATAKDVAKLMPLVEAVVGTKSIEGDDERPWKSPISVDDLLRLPSTAHPSALIHESGIVVPPRPEFHVGGKMKILIDGKGVKLVPTHEVIIEETAVKPYGFSISAARTDVAKDESNAGAPEITPPPVAANIVPPVVPPPADPTAFAWPVRQMLRFGAAELPVFEVSPELQQLVPPPDEDYEVDSAFFEDLALAISMRQNVLVVGPTGGGKTTGIEMLGALLNHPVVAINMRHDFKSSSFLGQVHVVEGASGRTTRFVPGVLPRAMESGCWLLVDEFDYCPSGILYTLQRVLSHRQLVLDEDGGRVVNAHSEFRLLATANTIGRGDDTGLYAGAQVLSEATLDRFATTIEHRYLGTGKHGKDLPRNDQEVVVVQRKSQLELEQVCRMVTVARLVRSGVEREECYCSFSTRRLIDWARKTVALGGDWARAARTTFLNKLTADDKKYVIAIIDRAIGKVS